LEKKNARNVEKDLEIIGDQNDIKHRLNAKIDV
jgi:hypothetical protein